jgi:hypothetical protein
MPARTERGWILRASVRRAARCGYYEFVPPVDLVRQFDGHGASVPTLYRWVSEVFAEELNSAPARDDPPVKPKPVPIPRNSVMATLKARAKRNQARERAGGRSVRMRVY